jgi:tetratricopeptide (TPR) repeat protein
MRDTHANELRAFLECWLDMVERRPQQAFQRIKAVIDCASSYYGGEARIQAAAAMRQAGDLAASLAWARAAIEYDPSLKTGHQLAADILLADGKIAEARAVAEESRSHIPEHIADALVRRIEDASRDRSLA